MHPFIIVNDGQKLLLKGSRCAIGRDFSNNLIIDHLFVSRFHAIMVAINGKWRITDKSTRGTLHNNRPLKKYEPTILENGDMINLADSFKFQFFTPAELDEAIYTKNHNTEIVKKFCDDFEAESTCIICSEIFINTVILKCGHKFCNYCITQWKEKDSTCPICRDIISEVVRDVHTDVIIGSYFHNGSKDARQKRSDILIERNKVEGDLQDNALLVL